MSLLSQSRDYETKMMVYGSYRPRGVNKNAKIFRKRKQKHKLKSKAKTKTKKQKQN